MNTCGRFLHDQEGAKETAQFCENMDSLFNAFNSSSRYCQAPYRHAVSEDSGHIEFFKEKLKWLQSLNEGKKRLPCVSGWIISIKSLLGLWQTLHTDHKLQFLLTRRLNSDCVENLFSVIRGKGGHVDKPDATQFRQFLRQVMVDSILQQSSSSNCLDGGGKFLMTERRLMVGLAYAGYLSVIYFESTLAIYLLFAVKARWLLKYHLL